MEYTIEHHIRVYNDSNGDFISVSPDGDGLDLVEIRQCDNKGIIESRITVPVELATKLYEALGSYLKIK